MKTNQKKEKEAICAAKPERENFQWLERFMCPLVPETVTPESYSYRKVINTPGIGGLRLEITY